MMHREKPASYFWSDIPSSDWSKLERSNDMNFSSPEELNKNQIF